MRIPYFLIALLLVSTIKTKAQEECVGGFAGEYACSGLDLLAYLDLDALDITVNNATANDCWGWVDVENQVEYAILGGRDRTIFIDISNPTSPQIIAYILTETVPSLWRDIKVHDDHAFIVSEAGGHGMQIFDLSRLANVTNPPEQLQPDAVENQFGNSHNIIINEESGYAYPVGTGLFNGGPVFFDISDPLNPVFQGGWEGNGYCHDAQVVNYNGPDQNFGGKEIFFGCMGGSGIAIVDVTDKTDPQELFASSYVNQSYTHQGWLTEDHRYFLVNDEIDELDFGFNTRTLIWDVSDLTDAVLVGEWFGPNASTDHNLYVKGNQVYMSNYSSGLRVNALTDLANGEMEEIAHFDVWPDNDASGYIGTWSNYPYFPSGNIIISAFHGFYVVGELPVSSVMERGTNDFIIHPNPVENQMTITLRGSSEVELIELLDMSGRVVSRNAPLNRFQQNYSIDSRQLDAGMYLVRLNASVESTQRVLVR